jgi:hypothetical protein
MLGDTFMAINISCFVDASTPGVPWITAALVGVAHYARVPSHSHGNNLRGDAMPTPDEPLPDFSDVQGGSSSTAPSTPRERTYTVVKGDSLSKIAKREYGKANQWKRIFEANRDQIQDPDLIHPGQVLRIPQE